VVARGHPKKLMENTVLTRDWYIKLEQQAAAQFINLPIEFQLKGYDYAYICKSYYNFFNCETNSRDDKLQLAKKFLKFIRSINKNRAKQELGEEFYITFAYFMENFNDLLSKQDFIHLETLQVLTDAIDKTQFIEDIISVDELHKRVEAVEAVKQREQLLEDAWVEFDGEYKLLNEVLDGKNL
jgi:hypothetical protein